MPASSYCARCGALNPSDAVTCFACGQPLDAPAPDQPDARRLIRSRYRLTRQLGVGGFGAVYQAEDTTLGNRLVALKEMSPRGLSPDEAKEATQAFEREALLLASLSHPSLPRIYERFEEAGRWYLVMDFIEGETLEASLEKRGGPLPVKEALGIAIQLTEVLGYLHSRQPPIIFRDLKPSNIMRPPDGKLVLIDLGIARFFKPGQSKDTIAFGSPGYAAPEQYGKAQTTPRADVYSLGALLHQVLTGNDPSDKPFYFTPLSMPHPAGLSALIERMVDMDEGQRPPSMKHVRGELERMLQEPPAFWRVDDLAGERASRSPARAATKASGPVVTPADYGGQPVRPWQRSSVLPSFQQRARGHAWVFWPLLGLIPAGILAAVVGFGLLAPHAITSKLHKPASTRGQGSALTSTVPPANSQIWADVPDLTSIPDVPALAPGDPRVVYEALLASTTLPTSVTLQRSDNDGANWQSLPLPTGISQVYWAGFFVSPLNAQSVFVEFNVECSTAQAGPVAPALALSSGANICTFDYFSTNGGARWSRVQWPVHATDTSLTRLGAFPLSSPPFKTQANRLYALLAVGLGLETSFVTSTDGGATWRFADQPLAAQGNCVSDYATTPTGSTVFAIVGPCGTANASLNGYASAQSPASSAAGSGGNEIWRSDDAGAQWTQVGALLIGVNLYDLHLGLDGAGQPVLYDDGFLPPNNTVPPTVTKASVDVGQTWQSAPLGVNGQYANSNILGTLSDGSIIEAFTDPASPIQQSQLFSWKAGDAAWHQLSSDFKGSPQYLLVIPSGTGHDTLWLTTSTSDGYSVQRLTLA
jgi:serine/threonine protein kinase